MLDIIIEKGKRPIIGKLYIIQLIEADLQMIIRIFLPSEGEEIIECNDRFSKANYRLHKNYSIKSAILEKWLVLDNSLLIKNETIMNYAIKYIEQ